MSALRLQRAKRPSAGAVRLGALAVCVALTNTATAQLCSQSPVPSLPWPAADRPPAVFAPGTSEYPFLHSSANLQGKAATEIWAPGLFWSPPVATDLALSDFRSLISVTNPSTSQSANVTISFFSTAGVLVPGSTQNLVLQAETSQSVPATVLGGVGGFGTARITSSIPVVGESWHRSGRLDLSAFAGGGLVLQPASGYPNFGMNCIQQMQRRDPAATTLYSGPIPFTKTAALDFLNGVAPLFWIANPGTVNASITITAYRKNVAAPVITQTATISPRGAFLWRELWNRFLQKYLNPAPLADDDYQVKVTSNQPIIGEMLMVDAFQGASGTFALGGRLRMGSTVLVSATNFKLFSGEFIQQVNEDPGLQTIIGLSNPTSSTAGNVTIRYLSRDGVQIGNADTATIPAFGTLRVGPGLTPNYPSVSVFNGYVDIQSCYSRLVGWTMHTSGDAAPGSFVNLSEVWGEELISTGTFGPGPGIGIAGTPGLRLVAPLVFVQPVDDPVGISFPGHTTATNLKTSDAGPYRFRFVGRDGLGTFVSGDENYVALGYSRCTFTYEDNVPITSQPDGRGALFFDSTNGGVFGTHAIGDPAVDWLIPGWPF